MQAENSAHCGYAYRDLLKGIFFVSDPQGRGECQKAFVQLAQQHLDSLYRTALRMTNDHAVAEDIVQEACLKAYANFARYSPDTNFKAWLFRILANLCIDHLRRSAKISMIPIDTAPVEGESFQSCDRSTDSPEVQAMRRDTQQALVDALATLAPEPRAVVVLILIEGMSYDEAAECLDMPLNTVRSKLHRARKRLQESLALVHNEKAEDVRHAACSPRVISLF